MASPVVHRQVLEAAQLAGEEATPERAIRDEADAQFSDRGEDLVLGIAAPQRILSLQSSDRVDRVSPADGRGCRFAQAEVAHLPLLHQLRHRADGVFDGDVRIDTMLVEEVDVVDSQPSERAFARLAHVRGAAVYAPSSFTVRATNEAKLRGHVHFVTPCTDRLADQ